MKLRPEEISSIIRQQIEQYKAEIEVSVWLMPRESKIPPTTYPPSFSLSFALRQKEGDSRFLAYRRQTRYAAFHHNVRKGQS